MSTFLTQYQKLSKDDIFMVNFEIKRDIEIIIKFNNLNITSASYMFYVGSIHC